MGVHMAVEASVGHHWGLPSLPLCGCYYSPLLFFLVPSHPSTSELCLSGWGEIKAGLLSCEPKTWGSWSVTPAPFLVRGILLARECHLGAQQCWLWGGDDAGERRLFPLPVWLFFLFVPLCW